MIGKYSRALLFPAFFLLRLALSSPVFAQIRDFVPVVRPVLGTDMANGLAGLESSFRSDGYENVADYVKAYLAGGFGSGFVYVAPDGANYVVTNRHVVSQADTVDLEFEKADGSLVDYRGCRVAAMDDQLDLALVSFPEGQRPFKAGLAFAAAMPEEGAELWTAGFPGLGKNPSWQLGKGILSNAILKVPELVDPSITTLIQHSAQVDPGNSGGPLLVAEAKAPGGYKVIGINTWRVSNRQATSISIPYRPIQEFIAAALDPASRVPSAASLDSRCAAFAAAAAKDDPYLGIARFLSDAYVAAHGEKDLRSALSSAPTKVLNEIMQYFGGYSPVEGMKLASAYALCGRIADDGSSKALRPDVLGSGAASPVQPVLVDFRSESGDYRLIWVFDKGKWKLSGFEPASDRAVGKRAVSSTSGPPSAVSLKEAQYRGRLSVRVLCSSGGFVGRFLDPAYDYLVFPYLGVGAEVVIGVASAEAVKNSQDIYFGMGLNVSARLPVTIGDFCLTPYLGLGPLICDSSDSMDFFKFMSVEGGIEATLGKTDGAKVSLTLGYRELKDFSEASLFWTGALVLGAGIAF